MIVYFANRKMEILGLASTNLPEGFIITDDQKVEEIDSGVATFSCRIIFDESNRSKLEQMTEAGNYLLRSNGDQNEFYTILETEIDTKNRDIYIYAEDAGLDLLNEIVGEFYAEEPHTADWYVSQFTADSGFEIKTNEIPSTNVRTLYWEGESTVTERLSSIATQFGDFEISYSFDVEGMTVTHKYIHIYKERGNSLEEQLRLNRDIDRIVIKKSVANLATALQCTGGIPDGKNDPITLEGYTYDDGEDFYVSGNRLYSRKALSKWSRYLFEKEPNQETGKNLGHIVKRFSYDTVKQSELCNRAITELKKICDTEINYEIDINNLPKNIAIGDRINIVDDAGGLYLSARILKLETSVISNKHTATLGEYVTKTSGISQKVEELAAEFAKMSKKTLYTWFAYADDEYGSGISTDSNNKTYMGTASNQLEETVDISDPSIFTWVKIRGEGALTLSITSSNGTIFSDDEIATVLEAHVFREGRELTTSEIGELGVINWYRDGGSIPVGIGKTFVVSGLTNKTTYIAKLEVT